ncbi:MAG TPA: histidine kinase [Verrucomicrobiae bacterium]|nr:histidine kinase [Verrucomicrobiae bacterium]HEX4264167.1 histidine kinase [Verrucomicrobiae bacterium]
MVLLLWPLFSKAQNLVVNGSFESVTPELANDIYTVSYGGLATNAVVGWAFGVSGGGAYDGIISSRGSSYFETKVIDDGSNAAFLQGVGSISQTLTLAAGAYKLAFHAMGRVPFGPNTIEVSLGDLLNETFTPTNTSQRASNNWIFYTYNFIVPASGTYVLRFSGTIPFVPVSTTIPYSGGSDYTTYIDTVSIIASVGPKSKQMSPGVVMSNIRSALPGYDIVFIGDSITAGATLSNPAVESASVQCAQYLGQRLGAAVHMSNQGHSGHTTVDWKPSTNAASDFQRAITAAASLESNQPGQLIFSIMLGANDSAERGPNGAPVSPAAYRENLQSMIDQFLASYPEANVFVHRPIFYTTNTQNGALYGPIGLERLRSYFPEIDALISTNAMRHPGHVLAGDKSAFEYFSTNYLTALTPEKGVQGTFYLHPNSAGAAVLGMDWADAIHTALDERPLPARVLTHISQVRNLTASESTKSVPVHLLGTMMDTVETDSDRRTIVLQDQTAGICVTTQASEQDVLAPFHRGDLLEIEGLTANSQFAPVVQVQMAQKLGTTSIPAAKPTSYQELVAGASDSQWVEVKGVVRQCFNSESGSDVQRIVVEVDGGLVQVTLSRRAAAGVEPDAEVKVDGICVNRFNRKLQASVPALQVPSEAQVIIEKRAPADPFSVPIRSPASLWTFSPQNFYAYMHRVHVRGIVTHAQSGSSIWIREDDKGLNFRTSQQDHLKPGDMIDVLGFPAFGLNAPRLEDAIFRKVGGAQPPLPIVLTNLDEAFDHEDDLVSVQGVLTQIQSFLNGISLTLDQNGQLFKAMLKTPTPGRSSPDWQIGAKVRITGISTLASDEGQPSPGISQPPSFQILLRSPADLEIVQPPPWWTLQHIALMLGVITSILIIAVGTVVMVSRNRLRQQQHQRQMAEAEFYAILSERNRLSREIHDTLAQGMTAVLVQLRLARKHINQSGETVLQHLDTALTLVGASLQEARNSIWNMRSHVLESSNLSAALEGILKQMADGTEIATSVEITGKPRRLAPVIENNVLRIGQEAITNSVKYSGARKITMQLDFGREQFRLRVKDDGLGFDPGDRNEKEGGFGLVGMRERAIELNGKLDIRSGRGQGAEVTLSVPILRD